MRIGVTFWNLKSRNSSFSLCSQESVSYFCRNRVATVLLLLSSISSLRNLKIPTLLFSKHRILNCIISSIFSACFPLLFARLHQTDSSWNQAVFYCPISLLYILPLFSFFLRRVSCVHLISFCQYYFRRSKLWPTKRIRRFLWYTYTLCCRGNWSEVPRSLTCWSTTNRHACIPAFYSRALASNFHVPHFVPVLLLALWLAAYLAVPSVQRKLLRSEKTCRYIDRSA
jgi:hypothetical protein